MNDQTIDGMTKVMNRLAEADEFQKMCYWGDCAAEKQGSEEYVDLNMLAEQRDQVFETCPYPTTFEFNLAAYQLLAETVEGYEDELGRVQHLLTGLANALHEGGYREEVGLVFQTIAEMAKSEFTLKL